MALLSDATVVVEASDTSGTLHQAAECVRLKKWLFIAQSVVNNPSLSWPQKFLKHLAALRFRGPKNYSKPFTNSGAPCARVGRVASRITMEWRQVDYDIKKVVDALKGEPINNMQRCAADRRWRRIEEGTRPLAFEHIGVWGAAQLPNEKQVALIPVPSSKCVDSSQDFTAKKIAEAIRVQSGRADVAVAPVLQWRDAMPSSHEQGGTREPTILLANLT
jgi:hypothetical protein